MNAIVDELADAPTRIAAAAATASDDVLHAPIAPGEWSPAAVLAHLRACVDVWTGVVQQMLAEDEPTIRAVSPRSITIDDPFAVSLQMFTGQRRALVRQLTSLTDAQWDRGATITGAGKPTRKTVRDYVERLARHERSHVRHLERALGG